MKRPTIYLVNPGCGPTYSGLSHCLDLLGRRSLCANLALPTLAALLPEERFRVVLCDENVEPVDLDLRCAVVGLTGYHYQRQRLLELAAAFRRRGRLVAVGGPFATQSQHLLPLLARTLDHYLTADRDARAMLLRFVGLFARYPQHAYHLLTISSSTSTSAACSPTAACGSRSKRHLRSRGPEAARRSVLEAPWPRQRAACRTCRTMMDVDPAMLTCQPY